MKKLFVCFCLLFFAVFPAAANPFSNYVIEKSGFDPETDTLSVLVTDCSEKTAAIAGIDMKLNETALENTSFEMMEETAVPVTWVFLVDTSSSVYASEKNAADDVAQSIYTLRGSSANDTYILMSFNSDVVIEGISSKPGLTLKELSFSGNEADYSKALRYAADYLKDRNSFEKQVAILFTDGAQPAVPAVSADRLSEMLEQNTMQLFTIGLRNSNQAAYVEKDIAALNRLAVSGHGKGYSTKNEEDILHIAENILAEVNRSMVISGKVPADFQIPETDEYMLTIDLKRADNTLIEEISQTINRNWTWPERRAETGFPETEETVTDREMTDGTDQNDSKSPAAFLPAVFSDWLSQTMMIASRNVPNYGILIFAALIVVVLVIILISIARKSAKRKQEEKKAAKIKELEEKSLNVRLSDGQSAPVNVLISDGETKMFGRNDLPQKQIIGLNGDPAISSRHFSLTYDMGKLCITDEGSSNGTMVNGKRIQTRTRLINGQVILAGESEFRVMFGGVTSAGPTEIIDYA